MAYTITRTEYGAALHDASCDMWLDLTISAEAYAMGRCRANYPVPAIPYAHFDNEVCSIAIWPGVMQVRISDEYLHGDYTGFGAVITFEHGVSCETRYDDFD